MLSVCVDYGDNFTIRGSAIQNKITGIRTGSLVIKIEINWFHAEFYCPEDA